MSLLELLQSFFSSFWETIILWVQSPIIIPIIIVVCIHIHKNKEYKKTSYYKITKMSYRSVKNNTGKYGEYLIYKYLKHYESQGAKFLFNIYIPKEDGETTEIDVLMICSKGIYVFESKNYSGWIFGSENQKYWYQTLPSGRNQSHKESFYNPIMQNHSHIKHLKALLGDQLPIKSIIVFSERCTIKSLQLKNDNISVIKRENVSFLISTLFEQTTSVLLSENDITNIYNKLYPYTQVDVATKEQHIANICNDLNTEATQQIKSNIDITIQADTNKTTANETAETNDSIFTNTENIENKTNYVTPASSELKEHISNNPDSQVLKCPLCNGNLVLRTATKGANIGKQFYGCSNFPKCKYIQNLKLNVNDD